MAKFFSPTYSLAGAPASARERAAGAVIDWCLHTGPHQDGFKDGGGMCLVVTGTSGLVLGMHPRLDVLPVLYVRRKAEAAQAHGHNVMALTKAAKNRDFQRWVFLDDIIATGATLGRTVRAMNHCCVTFAAALLYGDSEHWLAGHGRHRVESYFSTALGPETGFTVYQL